MSDGIRTALEAAAILFGGGGVIASIAALFKVRPEMAQVSVNAAQGAVIVQSGVISNLQAEIHRLAEAEAECEERYDALRKAFESIDERKNKPI